MENRKSDVLKRSALLGACIGALICGPQVFAAPTLQQRIDAATYYASNDPACTAIQPFYWEIGTASGALVSNAGGTNVPNPDVAMNIASASKWIFGTYALKRNTYSEIQNAGNIKSLNFTSAYHNMGNSACGLTNRVSSCFSGSNAQAGTSGNFYYDPAHLEWYAVNVSNLGPYYDNTYTTGKPKLNDPTAPYAITAFLQDLQLTYRTPVLAGGVSMTPHYYARFLQDLLVGNLEMSNHLLPSASDPDAVCAWTNLPGCSAGYSPVNQLSPGPTNDIGNEMWHYSLTHWIEDDPVQYPNGDNVAFSSAGLYGFYPWIDVSKQYYGILARDDEKLSDISSPTKTPFVTSVNCGRLIRKGWLSGQHP